MYLKVENVGHITLKLRLLMCATITRTKRGIQFTQHDQIRQNIEMLFVQLNEYETAPYFIQLNENLMPDCLLISLCVSTCS